MKIDETVQSLVDAERIKKARASHTSASQRLADAAAAVTNAERAKVVAESAARKSATAGNAADVEAAELALEQADRNLRVAVRLRDAAVTAEKDAQQHLQRETAEAHKPVTREAARLRLEATKQAEEAMKMLHAANDQFMFAKQLAGAVQSRGAHLSGELVNGHLLNSDGKLIRTVAQESMVWGE